MDCRYLVVAAIGLSVLACKREQHDPLAQESASSPTPAKAKKSLSGLFSDKAPTFPAFFNGVTPGMTVEEARQKIPGLDKDLGFEVPDYDTQASLFTSDNKRILTVNFSAGKEPLPLAVTAWGKPVVVRDAGRDVNFWFNPAAHVRAKIESGSSYGRVTLSSYVPAAEFLGSDKAGLAFQKDHPLIGSTADQIRKNYAAQTIEQSAAENAAQLQKAQNFAGTHVDLGAAQASVDLLYPPTEYESFEMKVHLDFDKGKVNGYTFGIEYKPYPQQKEDVLALMTKTYGKPKPVKDLGDTYLVFGKSPTVRLKDDTISGRWSFTVEK